MTGEFTCMCWCMCYHARMPLRISPIPFGTMAAVLRCLCLAAALLWLGVCVWAWWCRGSYADCGVGVRLLGFLTWGVLLCVIPVVCSLPPVDKAGKMRWSALWRSYVCLPVLLQCAFLLCWAGAPPAACAEGDILAAAGIPAALLVNAAVLLLMVLLRAFGKWSQ